MEKKDLLGHIIDIKERLARIEASAEDVKALSQSINVKVGGHAVDIASMKTSNRIFKWVITLIVAIGVGAVKALKN